MSTAPIPAEQLIVQALLANSGVAALTSSVMPAPLADQAPLPAITFEVISEQCLESHDGPVDLHIPKLQIVCWAEEMLQAAALKDAVRIALDGAVIGAEASPPWIQRAVMTDRRTSYEPGPRPLYRQDLDFDIFFSEE